MYQSFTQENYEIGSRIQYRAFGGDIRTVTVTEKSDDIKDCRPGFEGFMENKGELHEVWGYDYQIIAVLSK